MGLPWAEAMAGRWATPFPDQPFKGRHTLLPSWPMNPHILPPQCSEIGGFSFTCLSATDLSCMLLSCVLQPWGTGMICGLGSSSSCTSGGSEALPGMYSGGAKHSGLAVEAALCTCSCGVAKQGPWEGLAVRRACRTDAPQSHGRAGPTLSRSSSQLGLQPLRRRWGVLGDGHLWSCSARATPRTKAPGLHTG